MSGISFGRRPLGVPPITPIKGTEPDKPKYVGPPLPAAAAPAAAQKDLTTEPESAPVRQRLSLDEVMAVAGTAWAKVAPRLSEAKLTIEEGLAFTLSVMGYRSEYLSKELSAAYAKLPSGEIVEGAFGILRRDTGPMQVARRAILGALKEIGY